MRVAGRKSRIRTILGALVIALTLGMGTTAARASHLHCSVFSATDTGLCHDSVTLRTTLKGLSLRKTDGDIVSINNAVMPIDLGTVSANEVAAAYVSDASIPLGTYDAIILTLDNAFIMNGSTATGDGRICRTVGALSGDAPWGTGPAGDMEIVISDANDLAPFLGAGLQASLNGSGDILLTVSGLSGFPLIIRPGTAISLNLAIDDPVMHWEFGAVSPATGCTGIDDFILNVTVDLSAE